MQNGISAVKAEEGGKQAGEGNGQTGHESDEESDLEDEEEEHDDQVHAAWSRRFCYEHDVLTGFGALIGQLRTDNSSCLQRCLKGLA